jgi:organic hydroperoxide reductase OsmC/OhrA
MAKEHHYEMQIEWTGNLGTGTSGYRDYSRNHVITSANKERPIDGSSDPAFRGDRSRYNPEELLVAALSACHMLSLLHLCADAGIVVTEYVDSASGTMAESADGSAQFSRVELHPQLKITDPARMEEAMHLHHRAHELCFIARSVNFPVEVVAQS